MSRTITRWISGTCLLLFFLTDGQCCSQKNQRLRSSFKLNQTFGRFDLGTAFSLSLITRNYAELEYFDTSATAVSSCSSIEITRLCYLFGSLAFRGKLFSFFSVFSFLISNTRWLQRGINDVAHGFFLFSSRSDRSDNAYSFLPLRWPFFSLKANRRKSWKFGFRFAILHSNRIISL